jgi:hypothetical protein
MAVMVNENFQAAARQEFFAGSAGPELPERPVRPASRFT